MTNVPTLPKETAYLYARFNKIKKIHSKDFADIGKSKNSLAGFETILLPSEQRVH